ncbi:MAG: baseplate J/gp47 family protein [Gammaproteobacteria bacterium]|nr:baseplate J/gp47 family protein [Gammaproteobacteria bacterium]
MSIQYPKDQKELVDSSKTDFQRHNPETNPWLKNSFIGALLTSLSLRVWDFYIQLKEFEKELFLPTSDRFLSVFGAWWGVPQNQATISSGNVVATGTATSVIALGSQLQSTSGNKYLTTAIGTILTSSIAIMSMTRSGSVVTATTSAVHNLSSQINVTISGAVETEYNGVQSINVTGLNTFTFAITTTPTTPATGTILGGVTFANIPVESVGYGLAVNVGAGEALTFTSPIAGVDSDARSDYSAITQGADAESKTDWRNRILDRVQKPVSHFNAADIISKAKEVTGVTRVFVKRATPAAGQVTVYFVRDNDASIIPDAAEIATTKTKIEEILPATVDTSALIVSAPVAVTANFAFTAISPDTTTMRAAIERSLSVVVKKQTEGVDFKEDDYRSAIVTTVDRDTNTALTSFTLTTTGDFTVIAGSIAVMGTVTF